MDFVEKCRNTLNFIEDHDLSGRQLPQLVGKLSRIGCKHLESGFIQQIDRVGPGKLVTNPCALPHAAKPKKKERALRRSGDSRIKGCWHAVILPCKMTASCQGTSHREFLVVLSGSILIGCGRAVTPC